MRAVVRRGPELVCDEVADPVPESGQVLVKTLSCGICGSDLHALQHAGRLAELARRAGAGSVMDPSRDIVFGHEFCAEILDYGPGAARSLPPGTRVVSVPFNLAATGVELVGYSNRYPGGFGECMVLTEGLLLEVPNGLSAGQAALTEPFSVGAHAVARAGMDSDCVALVVGCGPVGLAVIAALKARGFGPVVAADFSPARRRVAERLGADILVDPGTGSPHAHWQELGVATSLGERAMATAMGEKRATPVIFECVGVPGLLQTLIEQAPPASRVVVAGVCMEQDRIEPALAINKEIDFRFVFGYSPEEFAATLRDIAEGRIDASGVISSQVGLDGTPAAFEALRDPEAEVKVMVEPGRDS